MKGKNTPFSIIQATLAEVDEIVALLYPSYFEESGFNGLTYSPENTKAVIASWVQNGIVFLIRSQGRAAAMASMEMMRSFYEEIEADITMFYVHADYRATGISRALADTLCRTAEMNGAKVVYSSCLSGMGDKNVNLYTNLWKKFGFRVLGTVMMRS